MNEVRPDVVRATFAVMTDESRTPDARIDEIIQSCATDDEVSFALGLLAGLAAKHTDVRP